MTRTTHFASVSVIALASALAFAPAALADALLAGTITAASGEKMGGVTVSAKAVGSTITTSVYTDADGGYYFPSLPEGKYKVWAQALTFQTAKGDVDLTKTTQQNFTLAAMTNQEDWIRQLPGDEFLNALPGDTPDDFRMKTQVRKNCTGCHSASYPLQHRFDEAGWSKVLDLMKWVNVLGVYPRPDGKPTGNIEYHQKELAAYLARARGPGESSMKYKLRPRPSGEAARVLVREYDFPMEGGHARANDGSDWSLGTPSEMHHIAGVHDAQMDFNGNIWITYGHASLDTTIAKIDGKTGAVKNFKLDDQRTVATGTHGITRDENGVMWFNTRSNVARGHGGLGRVDPKDEKVSVYLPPRSTTGTAGTIDADMNGNIWVTSPDGALRFDTKAEKFTEFKSVTYKSKEGTATVYGLAADRVGNGWWLLMTHDLVDYSDISTGKTGELRLPPEKAALDSLTDAERKFYDNFQVPDFNAPFPWAQAPRRMGADKNADFVYTGNSFGGTLARINIHTKETTMIPLPNPETDQPYQVAVDNAHNVWTNLWSTDKIAKYDPSSGRWTLFELPTRGTESRYISILEQPGKPLQVIVPYHRGRKVGVLTPRSDAEIAALPRVWSTDALTLSPSWLPKTLIGLAATANKDPGPNVDLPGYRLGKDFRAMMYCRFQADIDDGQSKVNEVKVLEQFLDPGWTPSFNHWKFPLASINPQTWEDWPWKTQQAYAGEASPVSSICIKARHPSSTMPPVPNDETVLAGGMIKFRAGQHTDNIGINEVGAAFHVPWVWCEMMLTYSKRRFFLYSNASIFPSHKWYVNGNEVSKREQVTDLFIPQKTRKTFMRGGISADTPTGEIPVEQMKIYPVLKAGAPGSGPQSPLSNENNLQSAVDSQPFSVSGGQAKKDDVNILP